jgi:hypothetical protein
MPFSLSPTGDEYTLHDTPLSPGKSYIGADIDMFGLLPQRLNHISSSSFLNSDLTINQEDSMAQATAYENSPDFKAAITFKLQNVVAQTSIVQVLTEWYFGYQRQPSLQRMLAFYNAHKDDTRLWSYVKYDWLESRVCLSQTIALEFKSQYIQKHQELPLFSKREIKEAVTM